MGFVTIFSIAAALTWLLRLIYFKAKYIYDRMTGMQGPAALPFIGNLHQFRFEADEFFEQAQGLGYMLEENGDRICRIWFSGLPFVLIYGAEEVEAVLSSSKVLHKPFHYRFLSAWIGDGLLISDPEKWRPRRKLLTPTFHYDILKDFVEVYNRHARTLCTRIFETAGEKYADVFHKVTLCTLDIICEAALGVNIDAQNTHSPYLDAVMDMKKIVFRRQLAPQYYPEFLFRWFGEGREQEKCVKILHDFTGTAIRARKKMADEAGGVQNLVEKEAREGRRRMAFLDLMLDMHAKGDLSLEGICEEVDTFTFEGHDTTSASINWFLHLMGANPDKQRRVQQELDEIFGDSDRDVTYEDLSRLKYMEAAIKETLRLYPSVPIFARQVTEDLRIKDHLLPTGTGIVIMPSMVHKDTRYWPDPEVFLPERFLDTEANRHPYSYIPFSAGSRNCIGQRFAIMEEKCVLAILLRQFKVEAKLATHDMRIAAELIIRPMYGNEIRLTRRKAFS
ncbi:cyp-42A1 [Pristionchus pacificus]|uniref:Cytochrome P450 n=1 Tax=Pristionchus pacificus TaxID=54126 RepID=A0A8R1ZA55_PRIPA|nr:cyp-42A1 [Pristionchus pacificus]